MTKIKELRESQAKLVAEARGYMDEAESVKDEARATELNERADKILESLKTMDLDIARHEQLEAVERALEAKPDVRRPKGEDRTVDGVDEGEKPTYRNAFHSYLRAQGNVAAMNPEDRAVLQAGYNKVDLEARAQTVGTDSAGGYTVPTELMGIIIKSMLAWGPMYDESITTQLVTSGGGNIDIPTVNDTAVTAGAHTEGVTLTDDGGKDVTFGKKTLEAYAFDTEWIRVSKELADDSIFAMEAVLGDLLGERLGRIANSQLTTGTGSSAPNGIVTASTAGKTAAATGAITWDEILDLEHSVDPAYRVGPKVRYMFNDSTLLACRKLKDGDGNYLWQAGNVQAGTPSLFNNRAYSINQAMDSLAAAKKVMLFGDFGKYYVRKVGGPLIGAIQDKDFWPGFGIAGYVRFDGELGDTAAVKHLITAAT